MDFTFSSKLQTTLENIGRKNGLAPPKSQDPADAILHEYYVSATGSSLFDKRKKAALEAIKRTVEYPRILETLQAAEQGRFGSVQLLDTENYNATLTTKTPATRVDVTTLTNELIKLGVDQVTIAKALNIATVKNKIPESYVVVPKLT